MNFEFKPTAEMAKLVAEMTDADRTELLKKIMPAGKHIPVNDSEKQSVFGDFKMKIQGGSLMTPLELNSVFHMITVGWSRGGQIDPPLN